MSLRLCFTKKNRKGREGKEGEEREEVLKLSSPPLHTNLKGINFIDLKNIRGNFFPSLYIKFYSANNKLNFLSSLIPSPPLSILWSTARGH
jgi:hypothetical protein